MSLVELYFDAILIIQLIRTKFLFSLDQSWGFDENQSCCEQKDAPVKKEEDEKSTEMKGDNEDIPMVGFWTLSNLMSVLVKKLNCIAPHNLHHDPYKVMITLTIMYFLYYCK